MELYLKFGGFYQGTHANILEVIEESITDIEDEESNIDYKKLIEAYSKEIVDFFNEKFNIESKFKSLYSPKFYNYETDEIEIEISEKDLKKVLRKINKEYELKEEVIEEIENVSKSKDGYIAFYEKEEIQNDLTLLGQVAIKVWFNTIGNELFVEQYDKSMENIINNDIYIDTNESKDLSI